MANLFTKDQWIQVLILGVTFWIGLTANGIASQQNIIALSQAHISENQTSLMERQTQIMNTQTKLVEEQTQISSDALQFEKDKNYSDTAKEYREKMNFVFDKITFSDEILTAVHEKIKNNQEITVQKNLDRYVNNFEDIGGLYCDGRIRFTDLKIILGSSMEKVCNSSQIFLHYQDTKSGISGMCSKLYSNSKMSKYANSQKCVALRK